MKTCPCCKSQAFEDLDTCYECLHPFKYGPVGPPLPTAGDAAGKGDAATKGEVVSVVDIARDAEGRRLPAAGGGEGLSVLGDVCGCSIDSSLDPVLADGGASWRVHVEPSGFPPFDKVIDSDKPLLAIGRAVGNDIIIADLHASRRHADLFVSEGSLWVRDKGSSNMTYLDGIPVMGTRRIGRRGELRVASARLLVEQVDT